MLLQYFNKKTSIDNNSQNVSAAGTKEWAAPRRQKGLKMSTETI